MTQIPNEPRVRARFYVRSPTRSTQLVSLSPSGMLLFFKGKSYTSAVCVAAYTGGVVYFCAAPGAEQAAVNEWEPDAPHVRSSSSDFDFIVGQVLTSAGLPLTQRET